MSLLELSGISKRFGSTRALAEAGLQLEAGEIHALCGANGAGKSTLARVISGHIAPDAGEIRLDGKPVEFAGARDALRAGLCLVTQETTLAPDLSVLENMILPRLGMPGRLDWRRLRREAEELVGGLGGELAVPLDETVGNLSIGQRQMVEILKALAQASRVIIFDEPTASLSPFESEVLFGIMRGLAAHDHGLLFVSHRMEEILAVCDRITVLREGRVVAAGLPVADMSGGELVRLMIGRALDDVYARAGVATLAEAPMLEARHLSSGRAVRDVSLTVCPGEIVGLAGLIGAGRSETLETIFGLRQATGGEVLLAGKPFRARRPIDAIRAGIGLVPEDRRRQSIVPDLSVRENLFLTHLGSHRGPGLGYEAKRVQAMRLLDQLGLPATRLADADLLTFSGGMQQKIILARSLLLAPRVLMLDEPTRGVDIGTRSSVYALLRQIAADGVAVLVVSSDFEEIIGLAERIVIVSDGVTVASLPSDRLSVESLAMFAAPRSSAQRTHAALEALVAEHGGVAAWVGVENDRLFCFDCAGNDRLAAAGFAAGTVHEVAGHRLAAALHARAPGFIDGADGCATLLVPVLGKRGHELGLIALTLPPGAERPDAKQVSSAVRARLSADAPVTHDAA